MAGTISLSMTQQLDVYGKPLGGGQLYIIQAGTVATPQNAFQDEALTIPMANPIPLDAAGRIPQFFLDDGQIKIRLQDKNGVIQLQADNILVIGPSTGGGGGGGGAVDPTTILSTGDLKVRYDTAVIPGWVRANGHTIGSALSGASELADATAQALFQFLWGIDNTLAVIPSRGLTAISDWGANKQITLPDWRGRVLAGLDGMGNTPASRLTTSNFGSNPDVLGAAGGIEVHTLTTAQMPVHHHTAGIYDPTHSHAVTAVGGSTGPVSLQGGGTFPGAYISGVASSLGTTAASTGIHINSSNGLDTTYNVGGSTAHPNCQPTKLVTVYLKL